MPEKVNRFNQLFDYMNQGWEIDEPVLLGAMWYPGANGADVVYHFILRNQRVDRTSLLSLPVSPPLLDFLTEHKIQVTPLSLQEY